MGGGIPYYGLWFVALWHRTIEVGADRFKIPDIIFNPSLVQVGVALVIQIQVSCSVCLSYVSHGWMCNVVCSHFHLVLSMILYF